MNFFPDSLPDDHALEINVTPLVDVVFQLLAFFMVTTTFRDVSGLDVKLPTASPTSAKTEASPITITLDAQEKAYLNSEPIDINALPEKLSALARENKDASLVLRADKSVPHGTIVTVLDAAKQNGIAKLAIATSPRGEE